MIRVVSYLFLLIFLLALIDVITECSRDRAKDMNLKVSWCCMQSIACSWSPEVGSSLCAIVPSTTSSIPAFLSHSPVGISCPDSLCILFSLLSTWRENNERMNNWTSSCQSIISGPATAEASSESLLELQILNPFPLPTGSKTLGVKGKS